MRRISDGALTHFPASDFLALLPVQCSVTGGDIVELNKSIGLLDGNLCKPTVLVKDIEEITLCYLLSW